jgi:hypothetical protein
VPGAPVGVDPGRRLGERGVRGATVGRVGCGVDGGADEGVAEGDAAARGRHETEVGGLDEMQRVDAEAAAGPGDESAVRAAGGGDEQRRARRDAEPFGPGLEVPRHGGRDGWRSFGPHRLGVLRVRFQLEQRQRVATRDADEGSDVGAR